MSWFCCRANRDPKPVLKASLIPSSGEVDIDREKKLTKLIVAANIANIPEESLKIERPVKGIDNLGNSCYMSSALECLGNAPELVDYILVGHWTKEANPLNRLGTEGKLLVQFVTLIHKLWEKSKEKSINVKKFKECLDEHCNTVLFA